MKTGRLLEHWHTGTMTRKAKILNELEPDPIIYINEIDFKVYNIKIPKILQLKQGVEK